MKLLVNLSWKCDLACPYCLLPHIAINRAAQEHGWADWAVAFTKFLPPGSSVDFAGGEPLLFPGLEMLLDYIGMRGIHWAITTNAMNHEAIERMVQHKPRGCIMVNVSDHPGNQGADANIARLREAFPVVINRVQHPDAGKRDPSRITSWIPYQSWREGTELDGIRRRCDTGGRHAVLDPGGDMFRCNPYMALGRAPFGNIFSGNIVMPEPIICETGCSTCYTSVPGAWQERMVAV